MSLCIELLKSRARGFPLAAILLLHVQADKKANAELRAEAGYAKILDDAKTCLAALNPRS